MDKLFADIRAFVDRPTKELLVIEPDRDRREQMLALIGNGDVRRSSADEDEMRLRLLE